MASAISQKAEVEKRLTAPLYPARGVCQCAWGAGLSFDRTARYAAGMRRAPWILSAFLAAACGADSESWIGLHLVPPATEAPQLRNFPPYGEPERVQVAVWKSSAPLSKPVAEVDAAWAELPQNPNRPESRYLLFSVKPNAGAGDPYLLKVASRVRDAGDQLYTDVCGTIGAIELTPGEKRALTVGLHMGDCGLPCSKKSDCVGSRFCLGFECQEGATCTIPEDCLPGATCDASRGMCNADCDPSQDACRAPYRCCQTVCALSCGLD